MLITYFFGDGLSSNVLTESVSDGSESEPSDESLIVSYCNNRSSKKFLSRVILNNIR